MCSVHSGGERWCKKKQKVINCVELDPDTHIRLIRGNVLRYDFFSSLPVLYLYFPWEKSLSCAINLSLVIAFCRKTLIKRPKKYMYIYNGPEKRKVIVPENKPTYHEVNDKTTLL